MISLELYEISLIFSKKQTFPCYRHTNGKFTIDAIDKELHSIQLRCNFGTSP